MNAIGEPFRLDSLRQVPSPDGGDGVWQHYVIVQGTNTITGFRSGTREDVALHIENLIDRLNERFRTGKPLTYGGGAGRKPLPRSDSNPKTSTPALSFGNQDVRKGDD